MVDYSSLPEVTTWEQATAGQRGQCGSKEVVERQEEKYLVGTSTSYADSSMPDASPSTMIGSPHANIEDRHLSRRRTRRVMVKACYIAVAAILIAIALGVGLGVGLRPHGCVTNLKLSVIEWLTTMSIVVAKLRPTRQRTRLGSRAIRILARA